MTTSDRAQDGTKAAAGARVGAAGGSAAAWAEEARQAGRGGFLRRALAAVGVVDPVKPAARALAARREAGAVGEEMTAALLAPLAGEGWGGFYDRALPGGGRANVDHVLVPPAGDLLAVVDAKLWSWRRGPVRPVGQGPARRLVHGVEDRQGAVLALLHETRVLQEHLGVRVVPVMCVHSAPVAGGRFMLEGITVLEAPRLLVTLRQLAGAPDPVAFARLTAAADAALPRYVQTGPGSGRGDGRTPRPRGGGRR